MPRPLRSSVESVTKRIPEGPLGFLGRGNALGAAGFTVTGILNTLIPISGVEIGYSVESHSVERQDGIEIHTFTINAASRDVARFAAKLKSAPSNIDFAFRETEVQSVEPAVERSTFNTWRVVVNVEDRAVIEDIQEMTDAE